MTARLLVGVAEGLTRATGARVSNAAVRSLTVAPRSTRLASSSPTPFQPSSEPILLRHDDHNGITTLTLNRPKKYNALCEEMLALLQSSLEDIDKNDSIRAVIIAANGKAFCPGHDLKEMRSHEERSYHRSLFRTCSRTMTYINEIQQPVIAQVHGIATAAGCQLVAACDLAVASEDARFAVSGINAGLFCSTPSVHLSRNIGRKRAMHMLLTGDFISSGTALEYGLVNQVVPFSDLRQETMALAQKILEKSPYAIRRGKEMFYKQIQMDLVDAYAYAADHMACDMSSQDAREGIDAFIEKRKPEWKDS